MEISNKIPVLFLLNPLESYFALLAIVLELNTNLISFKVHGTFPRLVFRTYMLIFRFF